MVRLAFRGAVGLLAAALATACLGGQTGQPSSLECDPQVLEAGAAWNGSTVRRAAQAFEGPYSAGLQWREEPRASTTQTPVDFPDSVQLTITYSDAKVTRTCSDQLIVAVSVALTSSASSLAESGMGTLTISRDQQGFVGSLHFEGTRVRLDAMLDETARATPPRGSLDALDLALPGASATLTEGQ
jgi:hypothetical protein